MHSCATVLGDTELLGKLSAGDMVALEAKYHTKCLVRLHNNARKARLERNIYKEQATSASQIAFAELALYIDEMRLDEETAPVFKLAELTKLYHSRIEMLGIKPDTRVRSTRLEERLLVGFPNMQAYSKRKNVLTAFEDDVGTSLAKVCELDSDKDAIHLWPVLRRLCADICLGKQNLLTNFPKDVKKNLFQNILLALLSMVLAGPSIKDQMVEATTPAAPVIAQML